MRVPGYETASGQLPSVAMNATLPGYFDALGIRLTSGRDFATADVAHAEPVGIVNATFVRRYFNNRSPLDRSIGVWLGNRDPVNVRIVGVARDAKYDGLREAAEPMLYMPMAQAPGEREAIVLIVRSAGDPSRLASDIRRAVDGAAPGVNVPRVHDMATERDQALTLERLATRLALVVSAMALLLSVVGLYGVVAYSVSRRTSEIGIRIALGARARAVIWLVAREATALVGLGIAVGIPLSVAANGALRSQLFGVGAFDPRAGAASVLLPALAGLAASALPARRAAKIEPRIALNAD
jgi:hypothetical protein